MAEENPAEHTDGHPDLVQDENGSENSFENVDLVDLIDMPAWKTILLDLVKREKMDPWDIDIAELADKYLKKINSMEKMDLRVPANAILASAILLKLKARTLVLSSLEEPEKLSPEEIARMEAMVPDITTTRKLREGHVTLDELVSSIESILVKTKKTKSREMLRQIPKFTFPFSQENIEKMMVEVYEKITERADSQGLLTFSRLVDEKTPMGIINVFVPMLFLMNKGKINCWQDDFFGEIFISLRNNNETNSEKNNAPAD